MRLRKVVILERCAPWGPKNNPVFTQGDAVPHHVPQHAPKYLFPVDCGAASQAPILTSDSQSSEDTHTTIKIDLKHVAVSSRAQPARKLATCKRQAERRIEDLHESSRMK